MRSLFCFALSDSVAYFFLVVFLAAFFVAFFAAFLVAIVTILPFRCDIENCSLTPQLHEGIVLRKINVKKKMHFCRFFCEDVRAVLSKEEFFHVIERTRRRKIMRKSFRGLPKLTRERQESAARKTSQPTSTAARVDRGADVALDAGTRRLPL
ncbi:MAG: hypothetical protein ACYCSP_01745 [Acidobacteriaceae bacterium]